MASGKANQMSVARHPRRVRRRSAGHEKKLASIFRSEYLILFVDYFYRLFYLSKAPPFFTKGWAFKILDENTLHKIIDNVLGTARDKKKRLRAACGKTAAPPPWGRTVSLPCIRDANVFGHAFSESVLLFSSCGV